MDYTQKIIRATRELSKEAGGLLLWEFPAEDFDAWRAMPDTPAFATHGRYLAQLAALQADAERAGKSVRRTHIRVADVVAELERNNWPNNAQHRAKAIATLGGK